ncbi:MAG: hypothetical protein M5U26_04935 [Planctomycetota bacterium]|nr:hypothetical protein [Planctomycetota bacterium]
MAKTTMARKPKQNWIRLFILHLGVGFVVFVLYMLSVGIWATTPASRLEAWLEGLATGPVFWIPEIALLSFVWRVYRNWTSGERFQLHLSTCMALVLTAALLLGANLSTTQVILGHQDFEFQGFPLQHAQPLRHFNEPLDIFELRWHLKSLRITGIIANASICIGFLFLEALALEAWIRKRRQERLAASCTSEPIQSSTPPG